MTNNSGLTRFSWRAVRVLALTAVPMFLLVQSSAAQNGANNTVTALADTSDPANQNAARIAGPSNLLARTPTEPFNIQFALKISF